ncbi:hypothetical protein WG66_004827, partial [Moniliophthora roreri]
RQYSSSLHSLLWYFRPEYERTVTFLETCSSRRLRSIRFLKMERQGLLMSNQARNSLTSGLLNKTALTMNKVKILPDIFSM